MREGLKPLVFVLQTTAGVLLHAQRGGCNTIFGLGLPQPHSSICLIPLWLSPLNRPSRFGRGRKTGTRAPPPNRGGMRSRKAGICNMPLFDRMTGRSRPHLSLREGSEPPTEGAVTMTNSTFDALCEAGASEEKARAAAGAIPAGEHLATKQDIAELKTDIATQFQRVYRHLWILGAGLIAANVGMLTAAVPLSAAAVDPQGPLL